MRVLPSLETALPARQAILEAIALPPEYQSQHGIVARIHAKLGILGVACMEQRLLEASLNEDSSQAALRACYEAARKAASGVTADPWGSVGQYAGELDQFLRSLYQACHALWVRAPWSYPTHVVYEVNRKLYTHDHLIVEIIYTVLPAPAEPTRSR